MAIYSNQKQLQRQRQVEKWGRGNQNYVSPAEGALSVFATSLLGPAFGLAMIGTDEQRKQEEFRKAHFKHMQGYDTKGKPYDPNSPGGTASGVFTKLTPHADLISSAALGEPVEMENVSQWGETASMFFTQGKGMDVDGDGESGIAGIVSAPPEAKPMEVAPLEKKSTEDTSALVMPSEDYLMDYSIDPLEEEGQKEFKSNYSFIDSYDEGGKITGKSHEEGGEVLSVKGSNEKKELEDGELVFDKETSALVEKAAKKGDVKTIGSAIIKAMRDPAFNSQENYGEEGLVVETESIEISDYIRKMANKYGISESLLAGVISHESGFVYDAKSSTGAEGMGQFTEMTVDTINASPTTYGLSKDFQFDENDPIKSIEASAAYLGYIQKKFEGHTNQLEKTLVAYNSGPNLEALKDKNKFDITKIRKEGQNYVPKVKKEIAAWENLENDLQTQDYIKGRINQYSKHSQSLQSGTGTVEDLMNKMKLPVSGLVDTRVLEGLDEEQKKKYIRYQNYEKSNSPYSHKSISDYVAFIEKANKNEFLNTPEYKNNSKEIQDLELELNLRNKSLPEKGLSMKDPFAVTHLEKTGSDFTGSLPQYEKTKTFEIQEILEQRKRQSFMADRNRQILYNKNLGEKTKNLLKAYREQLDNEDINSEQYQSLVSSAQNRLIETEKNTNKIEEEWKKVEGTRRGFGEKSVDGEIIPLTSQEASDEYASFLKNYKPKEGINVKLEAEVDPNRIKPEEIQYWKEYKKTVGKSFETEKPDSQKEEKKVETGSYDNIDFEIQNSTGGASNIATDEQYEKLVEEQKEEREKSGLSKVFDSLGGWDSVLAMTGMAAAFKDATTPLPQQKKSAEWNSYMDMMKARTEMGMSEESKTMHQRQAERTYWAHARQIGQYGTSAQAVLGGLGVSALGKYGSDLQMALEDQRLKDQRWREYGSALARDEAMTQAMWERNVFDESSRKRDLKAGLTGQVFKTLRDNMRYYKEYEDPDSPYSRLVESKIDAAEESTKTAALAREAAYKEAEDKQKEISEKLNQSKGVITLDKKEVDRLNNYR